MGALISSWLLDHQLSSFPSLRLQQDNLSSAGVQGMAKNYAPFQTTQEPYGKDHSRTPWGRAE